MKNILLVIFTLFLGLQLTAQEPTESEDKVYSYVSVKAEPEGGMDNFRKDFANQFNKLDNVPSDVKQLTIKIRFVVEKDGSLTDITVKDNKYGAGDEAIRVLKTMPKWKPAQHDGKFVRSSFTLPISILVNNDNGESYQTNLTDKQVSEYIASFKNKNMKNSVFQLECGLCHIADNGNNGQAIFGEDDYAIYRVTALLVDKHTSEMMSNMIADEVKVDPNLITYETTFLGEQTTGFKTVETINDIQLYRRLEHVYINGYFVSIFVTTADENLNEALTNHLKNSFKFNNN